MHSAIASLSLYLKLEAQAGACCIYIWPVAQAICTCYSYKQQTTPWRRTAMSTLSSILLAAIFVIAIDFVYSLLNKLEVQRLLRDSLPQLSDRRVIEKLNAFKFVARLKLLIDDSCPSCRGTNIGRSHRYFFEKPLSIFGVWPYRCSDCKARFRKTLGRHFVQAASSSKR